MQAGILLYALLLTGGDGPSWVMGVSGVCTGSPGLGCLSLLWAQWAEWLPLSKNSCTRQQSNKSNPICSLPWDVPVSWKVHLWQFPGLVTFSVISLARSSKVRGFVEWEIINEKKKKYKLKHALQYGRSPISRSLAAAHFCLPVRETKPFL